jgi:hypothetical protein
MSTIVKVAITIVSFLVAIGIASFALEHTLGRAHPAWTIVAALILLSPVVVLLWRDRLI